MTSKLKAIASCISAFMVVLLLAPSAFAHGGGLDKYGCHNNRKTGDYHCHRGSGPPAFKSTPRKVKPRPIPALPQTLLETSQPERLPANTKAIDGDTIIGNPNKPRIRLVGCDTPETIKPKCDAEKKLGNQAKRYLQKLLSTDKLTVEIVPCSCKPETLGTKKCNQGRRCGIVRLGSANVCDILISEGLAHAFNCGPTSCPKQQSWCDGDNLGNETLY